VRENVLSYSGKYLLSGFLKNYRLNVSAKKGDQENASVQCNIQIECGKLEIVSYNLFASIGILTPIGKAVEKKSTLYIGIIGGGVLLLLIALGIMLTMAMTPESITAQLPMLAAAQNISKVFTYIFAFLLFGGMFGTSVSSVFAIDEFAKARFKISKKGSVALILCLSVLSFIGSIFGFDKLIGIVYPVCGYLGVAALVLIVVNFVRVKLNK
jgi:uncharacterized membrane protein YkvI